MLSRREILQQCLVTGALTLAAASPAEAMIAAFQEQERRHPTPTNELGPFYKKSAPANGDLRLPTDAGMPLAVSGVVADTRGDLLPNATIEIWHADHYGHYDLRGYRFRAKLPVDAKAQYSYQTVMPGHYPDRVCQHVHYVVTAPGHKTLVTQLYFATDPVFDGDPDKNYTRDPLVLSRELVRPVMLTGDPRTTQAAVRFEVCLEKP